MPNPRKLLLPFSLLYGGIMDLRNKLYDRGVFKSEAFDLPVIAVGNLSFGGTGKSPMIEYLASLLKEEYRVAILSRGYKRKTKGFYLVAGSETAEEVGDEPLQFKMKLPEVSVAVDENRARGIRQLLETVNPDVILLDDAFQHRKVRAGMYVLLSAYDDLYVEDNVLPAGNLREPKPGASRADILVITKCSPKLTPAEMDQVRKQIKPGDHQHLFFSTVNYDKGIFGKKGSISLRELQKRHFTLVTGIANPKPLVKHLKGLGLRFDHQAFPDHHNFTTSELVDLKKKEFILTTEKDYMRLKKTISDEYLFYLPIRTAFLAKEENFNKLIFRFMKKK